MIAKPFPVASFWCRPAVLASAEVAAGILAVRTTDGVMVTWNQPGNHFTAGFKGRQIERTRDPKRFTKIDGTPVGILAAGDFHVGETCGFRERAVIDGPFNPSTTAKLVTTVEVTIE